MALQNRRPGFQDTFVVYWSDEDLRWIAHSLRTDQVGVGHQMMEALVEGFRAVDMICAQACQDESLMVLDEAPAEIQALAAKAIPLPPQMSDLAQRMARGEYPEFEGLQLPPQTRASYVAQLEEACAG